MKLGYTYRPDGMFLIRTKCFHCFEPMEVLAVANASTCTYCEACRQVREWEKSMLPQPEFLDADSRLADLFRQAEEMREAMERETRKPWVNVLQVLAIWIVLLGLVGVIWWGILRDIGAL